LRFGHASAENILQKEKEDKARAARSARLFCVCRKDAYDGGFFAKVRSARAVGSVREAEAMAHADVRIM
jgi:hypothetical protein